MTPIRQAQGRRLAPYLLGAVLLASGATFALKQGDTVFVRARDSQLLKKVTDSSSSEKLQPGTKLLWQEQSAENPKYHKVQVAPKGKTGFMYYANLSATAPRTEIIVENGQGASKDAAAFASKAAAARGLTPAAETVGKEVGGEALTSAFREVEKLAKEISASDVERRRKASGLTEASR